MEKEKQNGAGHAGTPIKLDGAKVRNMVSRHGDKNDKPGQCRSDDNAKSTLLPYANRNFRLFLFYAISVLRCQDIFPNMVSFIGIID